jgi:hypothetical protein
MKMITGEDFNLDELLSAIIGQLTTVNSQQQFFSFQFSVLNYTNKLYRYKQWASYKHEGSVKEMMIVGYDQFGRLILKEKNDHEVVCDLKEIVFV